MQDTPFNRSFKKLENKAQDLWGSCGASLLVLHSSRGVVHLTASRPIHRAIVQAARRGDETVRRCLGPGVSRACQLVWNKEPVPAQLAEQKQIADKWRRASELLVRAAAAAWDKRGQDEGAAYLIYGICGTGQPISAAEGPAQQLMAAPWWQSVVLAACSNPVWEGPPRPVREGGAAASSSGRSSRLPWPANRSAAAGGPRRAIGSELEWEASSGGCDWDGPGGHETLLFSHAAGAC